MFICDPCLEEKYTNSPSIGRHLGTCECCNHVRDCSDIPATALNAKDEVVSCTCDTCGVRAHCLLSANAPDGWFYVEIYESDEARINNESVTTVLACSEACKALPWRRQP